MGFWSPREAGWLGRGSARVRLGCGVRELLALWGAVEGAEDEEFRMEARAGAEGGSHCAQPCLGLNSRPAQE